MRNVGPCLSLIAALLCAAPVRAGDPDLPDVDPPGQGRVMTHDDATTTSKCIGKPITPLCAVETIIACFERKDGELCRIAMNVERRPFFEDRGSSAPSHSYKRYRVISAKRFETENLPPPHHLSPAATPALWWFTEDRRQYSAGDLQIEVLDQTCWLDPPRCDPVFSNSRRTYHLRRMGDRWSVLIWESPDPRFMTIRREEF